MAYPAYQPIVLQFERISNLGGYLSDYLCNYYLSEVRCAALPKIVLGANAKLDDAKVPEILPLST